MAERRAVRIDRVVVSGAGAAPTLAALQRACFGRDWGLEALHHLMAAATTMTLVARTVGDDEAVGFLLARSLDEDAEVLALGVDEGWRRLGIASGLLGECQRWAAAEGAIRLLLEVAETNHAARAAYLNCGFAEVGRRARYYAPVGTPRGRAATDALILCASLEP